MADADDATLLRKQLELDFDDKARDLKAQHKRQMEALQQDRVAWEAHRRDQQRDLADRAERLRRAEENHAKDQDALRQARRELEQVKQTAREAGEARVEAKAARSDQAEAAQRLERARDVGAWFAILALAGFSLLLAVALWQDAPIMAGVAGTGLALGLVLEWRRRRLAR